ncbi:MAG TPA: hypothetical protein VJ063_13135 [Verrucomicrobiae bacterium]|nr:hypothetical protein [Verrucomicrobiae bacterium]
MQNNVIELNIRTTGPAGYNASAGLFLYGGSAQPHYRMRQIVLRDNLIRNIENRSDPNRNTLGYPGLAEAIRREYPLIAENALWQNNIVRLDRDEIGHKSMTYSGSELKTFGNSRAHEELILAGNRIFPVTASELVTVIEGAFEDSLITSLLK